MHEKIAQLKEDVNVKDIQLKLQEMDKNPLLRIYKENPFQTIVNISISIFIITFCVILILRIICMCKKRNVFARVPSEQIEMQWQPRATKL